MQVQNFLALKFLAGNKRRWGFSSFAWMAILGVFVSVFAFLVVEAVMTGFSQDMRSKILGFSPHITLKIRVPAAQVPDIISRIKSEAGVARVDHFVEGEAILNIDGQVGQGVQIRGVESGSPSFSKDFQIFFQNDENWDSLSSTTGEKPISGILLGHELNKEMGLFSEFQEEVELLYPFGEVGPSGQVEPNRRMFHAVGTFKSGYYEFDRKFVIIDLVQAKHLLGDQSSEKIGIYLKDPNLVSRLVPTLKAIPGIEQVQTWEEQHARLFSALKLERIGMGFVLILMIALSSFNILSMLMMVAYERRREIAVLRALGASSSDIAKIFYRAGLWIGMLGTSLGMLFGVGLCLVLEKARLPLPSSYYLEALPISLKPKFLFLIFILSPILCVLATLIPAQEGKNLTVVEALRHE